MPYDPEISLLSMWPKESELAECQWFTPITLDTQEAEIRRTVLWSQPKQIVCKTLSWKTLHRKKRKSSGGVAQLSQGVGPEFKPQNHKKGGKWNCYVREVSHTLMFMSPFFIVVEKPVGCRSNLSIQWYMNKESGIYKFTLKYINKLYTQKQM
jgi:hypothetical protein